MLLPSLAHRNLLQCFPLPISLDWLDFDIWSVPCPENGWNPKKHFHLFPCFQLHILWARNTFLLHLATEVLGFISYKASVNSSNRVKKGIKSLRGVYCVLDLAYTVLYFIYSPNHLMNSPKAVPFHYGKTDAWVK